MNTGTLKGRSAIHWGVPGRGTAGGVLLALHGQCMEALHKGTPQHTDGLRARALREGVVLLPKNETSLPHSLRTRPKQRRQWQACSRTTA
eukprot:1158701-Pelagomonas_calceolata.AAC.3